MIFENETEIGVVQNKLEKVQVCCLMQIENPKIDSDFQRLQGLYNR